MKETLKLKGTMSLHSGLYYWYYYSAYFWGELITINGTLLFPSKPNKLEWGKEYFLEDKWRNENQKGWSKLSEFPEVQGYHNDHSGIPYLKIIDYVFVKVPEHYWRLQGNCTRYKELGTAKASMKQVKTKTRKLLTNPEAQENQQRQFYYSCLTAKYLA